MPYNCPLARKEGFGIDYRNYLSPSDTSIDESVKSAQAGENISILLTKVLSLSSFQSLFKLLEFWTLMVAYICYLGIWEVGTLFWGSSIAEQGLFVTFRYID